MVAKSDLLDGSKWNDEDIVISGISARLPNCDSVEEFQSKLLSKIDLITDEPRRFQNGLYGAIKRYGLLKDLSKFDAKFFNIHPKQAERMDPQIRGLLEVAFEATVDAGLHPEDLKGSKTGVVVGIASSETQDKWSQMPDKINGFEYTGCTRTMFANRVSYMLDLKGPSYSIDTASSTTLVAFQQAYDMIKDGVCEACFVCGTDLVLNPCVCLMFQCLNMLSPEGKCKAFDISGDGYVRSEGVVAVLLQKAKSAKRVYAQVLAAGSNCDGYKDEGITFPSGPQQVKLFRRVAQLANIDPSTIDFMEAHGSATRVGDPQEMNAVTEVFCKNRKEPLRTGSIKSNMGHAEPASALSAVIKVCVAMECGILPPNLHYNVPNPDIPALLDGRLKVITEPTPWDGGLVAVNSFGVGGANGHALLLSNKKVKQNFYDNIPRLVCVSGVTESAVETMFQKLSSLPKDPELYALLNNIFRKNIRGHDFRGYVILGGNGDKEIKQIQRYSEQKLCLILPGIEAEWKPTGSDLFNIIEFQNSINNCQNVLKTVVNKIDLRKILETLNTEKSLLNVILGITALQIGTIDVLKSLNLEIDFIIGLNIGEIAAGYANGCYTLQQAVLSAFHIGSLLQRFNYPSTIIKADVPWNKYLPPADSYVFAKISSQCTYFSGPKQSIDNFNKTLSSRGVNVKEIGSNPVDIIGILKSSKNISKLTDDLQLVLSNATLPSKKWLTFAACESSTVASYLISSLTSASPIQKALYLEDFSFGLEVGFSGDIEVLKTPKIPALSLFNGQADAYSFVSSIGKIFNVGFQPQIQNLYPKIEFPVSHKTPMIQSMIEWDHSVNWNVVSFAPKDNRTAGEIEVVVDFDKEEFKFLPENYLNNNELFPKSFYITLLWRAFSRLQVKPISEIPLVVENVSFVRETVIPDDGHVTFFVNIMNTTNKFEIFESGSIVASGHAYIPPNVTKEFLPKKIFQQNSSNNSTSEIFKTDIYNDLSAKHYNFNEVFQSLKAVNYQNNSCKVTPSNWNSLLESALQFSILSTEFAENSYSVVSFIRKIVLDPTNFKNNEEIIVKHNNAYNVFNSDCMEIRDIKIKTLACTSGTQPKLEAYKFVPFVGMKLQNACDISLQIALENWCGQSELKVAELSSYNTFESLLSPKIVNGNPTTSIDITVYSSEPLDNTEKLENNNIKTVCKDLTLESVDTNCHIVIASNVLSNSNLFENVIQAVRAGGCVVLQEDIQENVNVVEDTELKLVSYLTFQDKAYIVLKKANLWADKMPYVVTVSNDSLDWIKKVQQIPDQLTDNVLIIARGVETYNVLNFTKSVKAEVKNKNISIVIIEDETAPMFSVTCEMYHVHLKSNYPVNVFKNGTWGTYVYLPLSNDYYVPCDNVYAGFDFDKDPTSISWIKNINYASKSSKNNKNICCEIYSASLDLQSQALVKGKFADVTAESKLGLEFSGYNGKEKIFGLVKEGAIASNVIANDNFVWNVPKNWTMEEAATVPFAYVLAYYSLCLRSGIEKGNSVLIIGANSIAIASLYIALQYQLNPFVLLTDKSQKLLLKKLFPQIKDTQFLVSQNDNFYVQLLQKTDNTGVNILFDTTFNRAYNVRSYINSLSPKGKLVYFDNDSVSEENFGSSGNMRCLTCHRITVSRIFDNDSVIKQISDLMQNGLKSGAIQPLPYTSFAGDELQTALSHSYEGNNMYKTIINVNFDKNSTNTCAKIFNAKPRAYFDNSKSYIVLGGTTGFGLYVTNWMISHGVKNVVLVSLETVESESEHLKEIYLHKWKSLNASVITLKSNDLNLKTCENILKKAQQLGPIEGVFDFTASKVLENKSIDALNENDLKNIKDYKIDFLKNMDTLTRKIGQNLKYFVSFSAVEFLYGDKGYGLNSYINGLIQNVMRKRKDTGLCATLIHWGNIGELEKQILYENTKSINLAFQPVNSCLKTLHKFLENSEMILSSYIINERSGVETYSKADAIVEGVAKFLGIKNPSSILPTLTMLELGLDSLIGTDIQQFMEINYGVTLSTQEVRELTFEKLRNLGDSL
ncbi:fatty acid synthase-like [Planococcus citri]|uniref:fatty acid synthase-like n=1 Tax=Planococcus citri TaxID=170843 RepID=UPI0031F9F987